jgi:hypothetical protein
MIEKYQTCIKACNAAITACEQCAKDADPKTMARCLDLSQQCALVCRTAAELMSADSEFAASFGNLCSDVCRACADECGNHDTGPCRKCAEACEHCAEECENMAGAVSYP